MGDGVVLEYGTHSELLARVDGAYVRLVNAQRLRYGADKNDIAYETKIGENQAAQKASVDAYQSDSFITEELPAVHGVGHPEKTEYSAFYLLLRMANLNRESWTKYTVGAIAAVGKYISHECR